MSKFISVEGIDGSGITTQTKLLASYLSAAGKNVLVTEEPTNSMIGMLIKGRLAKEWHPSELCMRFLFAADTANHFHNEIELALKEGKHIICDRFLFSALAYGAVDFELEWLEELYKEMPQPDITFFLKISPKTAIRRLGEEGMILKFFERETHLQKVAENYEKLAHKYSNFFVIDGEKPVQEVHKDITKIIKDKL